MGFFTWTKQTSKGYFIGDNIPKLGFLSKVLPKPIMLNKFDSTLPWRVIKLNLVHIIWQMMLHTCHHHLPFWWERRSTHYNVFADGTMVVIATTPLELHRCLSHVSHQQTPWRPRGPCSHMEKSSDPQHWHQKKNKTLETIVQNWPVYLALNYFI